jgi:hypothetical protein
MELRPLQNYQVLVEGIMIGDALSSSHGSANIVLVGAKTPFG